jgi:hypothetical protein
MRTLSPTTPCSFPLTPSSLSPHVGGTRELAPTSLHPHPPPSLPRPHPPVPRLCAHHTPCPVKHLQHECNIYRYIDETFENTVVTYMWNICNIQIKYLQHICEKICNIHIKHLLQQVSKIFFFKTLATYNLKHL